MTNKKAYIVKENFKAPFVVATGMLHKPQRIEYKTFRKGQIINGEMKYNGGKPAFVLVGGIIPVECRYINELSQKEINQGTNSENTSSASGDEKKTNQVEIKTNPKVKYIDAMLIGALVGALGVHFAEKKGYITNPDQKNKLYGAVAGALLAWYVVYRQQANKKIEIKVKN